MSKPQAGTVYWYFPVDADHDISQDVLEASLDTVAWVSLLFIAPGAYTPALAEADTATRVEPGFKRYWWRALTGPGQQLPLVVGTNIIYGRLADATETPHFAWTLEVDAFA